MSNRKRVSIQLACYTLAQWTAWNGVLLSGQVSIVSDAVGDAVRTKIGDGVTTWTALPYYNPASSSQTLQQTLGFGNTTNGDAINLNDNDEIQFGDSRIGLIKYDLLAQAFKIRNITSLDYLYFNDAGGIDLASPTGYVSASTNSNGLYIQEGGVGGGTFLASQSGSAQVRLFQNNGLIELTTLGNIKFSSVNTEFASLTASTVPYLDASKYLVSSTVTPTVLNYITNLTSDAQTQLNAKQDVLVSATNIKTVGGVSLLGAGDLGSISTTYTDAKIKGAIAASNRIAFGSGVADTLTDSANITYNGTTFEISGYLSVAATSIPFYLNSTNSNVNKLQFTDNGTSRGYLGASSLYCFTAYESTGAAMRLGLTSAGNLLVGATSSSGTNVIGDFSRSATAIVQHRVTNASTSNGAYTQYTVYNTTANILNLGVVNTGTTTSGVYVQAGGYNMATGSGGYSIGTLNAAGVVRMYGGNGVLCFTVDSSSHFEMADGKNWKTNTSTGSKLCDSTSQKFAFWNKTPIVQPTTSITGAALTSNLGTPITSTDTFGGYTLQQLAAIIINTGLAA